MKKTLIGIAAVALVIGAAGVFTFARGGSVEAQARAAYKAGDYQAALPLLKKWANEPEVRSNKDRLKEPLGYIREVEAKLNPGSNVDMPLGATAKDGSAAPGAQGDMAQQAMSYALSNRENPYDPPMGADRIAHPVAKSGEVLALTVKQVGNFEFDPENDKDVPADVKNLDGAKVKISGYIMPTTEADSITEFALVPSLFGCCFGAPPGVQHVILCKTPAGKGVEFTTDEVEIDGILHVRPKRQDGYTYSLFEMDATAAHVK